MEDSSKWGNDMQQKVRQHDDAKRFGRSIEDDASRDGWGRDSSSKNNLVSARDEAKNAENGGGFVNSVQGRGLEKAAAKAMPSGKMFLKGAKKFGPIGSVLALIACVIGVLAGSNSFAAFSLVANGLDQFNTLRTSMNLRSGVFMRTMLLGNSKSGSQKIIGKKYLIFGKQQFKVSKSMQKRFAKNGIHYTEDENGRRYLVYEDPETGKHNALAASDADVENPPKSLEIEIDGEKVNVDIDSTKTYTAEMNAKGSTTAKTAINKALRPIRGHIAGWFDKLSEKLHNSVVNSSRNKQRSTDASSDEEDIKNAAKSEGLEKEINGTGNDVEGEIKDKDGKPVDLELGPETDDNGISKGELAGMSTEEAEKATEKAINGKVGKYLAGAGLAAGVGCTAVRAFSMLSQIISAISNANVLNFTTGFLEAVQKTQAGDASVNLMSTYMNGATKKGDTYGVTLGEDGKNEVRKPVRSGTSSMESPAWNQFYSAGSITVSPDDPVALKYNQEYALEQGLSEKTHGIYNRQTRNDIGPSLIRFLTSQNGYYTCLGVGAALNATSLALTVVSLIGMVAAETNPITLIISSIGKIGYRIWKASERVALQAAIIAVIFAAIPHVAKWLASDIIDNMSGEDMAYAINSGMNIYLGSQMQQGSGLPASKERLMANWRAQQEVIASEAEYERTQHSPFDPTNKYTFIGSIVNSLMPIANTMSSPLMTISKTMNTVGSYAANLLPTARADGEVKFETSINENCPSLSSLDLVGDAYCNPYFTTDVSTISEDPESVADKVFTDADRNGEAGNFLWDDSRGDIDTDGDGEADVYNPPINPDGEYAKWVLSCANRSSSFGLHDANLSSAMGQLNVSSNSTLNTVLKTGISAVPLIGDASQLVDTAIAGVNDKWIRGEECLSEQSKYYSRYSEDQRLMESAGMIETSSTVAFLDDYYKGNPVDNSNLGIIARYSGLTKDQVEDTLAYFQAIEWLAEYNPETYGPKEFKKKPDGSWQYNSDEIVAYEKAIFVKEFVFDDLRERIRIA